MQRSEDGRAYRFCLHAVPGRIRDVTAEDVTCDVDSGLTLLLEGTLAPGALGSARAGTGVMALQTGRLGGELARVGRTMAIDFANDSDRIDVQITVVGQREDGGVAERGPLGYSFFRYATGAGAFAFASFANIHEEPARFRKERLDMAVHWLADQSGRGLARVTGGDLGADEVLVDQCWDASGADVYVRADITTRPDDPFVDEGSEGPCSIASGGVQLPAVSDG